MAHFTYPHQDFVHYIAYGELPYTALRRPSPLNHALAAPPSAPNLPQVNLGPPLKLADRVLVNKLSPGRDGGELPPCNPDDDPYCGPSASEALCDPDVDTNCHCARGHDGKTYCVKQYGNAIDANLVFKQRDVSAEALHNTALFQQSLSPLSQHPHTTVW